MRFESFRQRSLHPRLSVEAELFALGSSGLTCLGEVDHLDANHGLAADCIHVSGILPSLLNPWHVPDTLRFLPDCISDESCELLVVFAVSEDWFEVVIFRVKETREELAVGGQSKPITIVAEGFTHRSYHPEFPSPIYKLPDRGRFAVAPSRGENQVLGSNSVEDLLSGHHLVLVPDIEPVERHELDKPDRN